MSAFVCLYKLGGVSLVHHVRYVLLSLHPRTSDAGSGFMYIHLLDVFLPPHLGKFYNLCKTVFFGTCLMKALFQNICCHCGNVASEITAF